MPTLVYSDDMVETMEQYQSLRTTHRMATWLAYINKHANDEGLWSSNRRSRAGLPDAELMSDDNRHRFLKRMVKAGILERTSKGQYKVVSDDK